MLIIAKYFMLKKKKPVGFKLSQEPGIIVSIGKSEKNTELSSLKMSMAMSLYVLYFYLH